MSWFEHGGQRVYYEESGSGEPLLLIPGWGGSIEELGQVRSALASRYHVIAADPPGSGKSQPQPREYSPSYLHDDAKLFLKMLDDLAAKPAHLVGFSDGGEYELIMAGTEPAASRSLVTWGACGQIAAPPPMYDAMEHLIDHAEGPMEGFAEYMKSTYGEANARVMTQTLGRALRAINSAGGDVSLSLAPKIACPALLITGEQDFLAPPALVSKIASTIPHAEFVEAKNASHQVHAEEGEWLVRTITEWLERR